MAVDRLDQNIKRHYRDRKLDSEAMDRLKRTIATARPATGHKRGKSRTLLALAIAVMVAAAIGTAILLTSAHEPEQVAREICAQAALVHNQNLDMEFEAADYEELRQTMEKLDFTPVEPARFQGMEMKIVGARYGLLEGQPAVQITLLDPGGGLCTLYQLRPVGKLAELSAGSREVDGLAVDLWQEKGLLMVLARPAT